MIFNLIKNSKFSIISVLGVGAALYIYTFEADRRNLKLFLEKTDRQCSKFKGITIEAENALIDCHFEPKGTLEK